jgi:hypothetical protein
MMRAVLVLVAMVGVAHADAPATIKAPAGWAIDDAQSADLGTKLEGVGHFGYDAGAVPVLANANVFVAPKPGAVLTVELVVASGVTEVDAAARAAIDELHATSQRAAITGSGIREDGWQEKAVPAAKQVEATLAWRDGSAKTRSDARRIVIATQDGHIVSVTGECFASEDADAKLVADCKAALATLDPGIDAGKRVAIGLAPPGTRPAPPAPAAGSAAAGSAGTATQTGSSAPSMASGPRAPLPPMMLPAAQDVRTVDRRPVYVGIGLVVLAAVFWWNRRRRARLEGKANE